MADGAQRSAAAASARGLRRSARLARGAVERAVRRLDRLADGAEAGDAKAVADLVGQVEKALMAALATQRKIEDACPTEPDGALDLEGARAEILGRLARIAERG